MFSTADKNEPADSVTESDQSPEGVADNEESAWQKFLTDSTEQQSATDEQDDGTNYVMQKETSDSRQWDSSEISITERINNLNISGQDLPRMKGRLVTRKMMYQKDFDRAYSEVREQGLQENSTGAWATLKFSPEMIGEEVTGIRLDDTEATEFLEKNGLEDGDVIKEVNGSKLDSPEAAFSGMNTIGESENLDLVIDRGGEIISININKNQIDN